MVTAFRYKSYSSQINAIPKVMDHMLELQKELQGSDLQHLQHFNITYFIITKNVFTQTKTDYFSNSRQMIHVDINFAKYYFNALKSYVDKSSTTPAWKTTFDFSKKDNSIPLIYLALGVNAHVNNDLGLSLFDTVSEKNFKNDFDKVNPIIFQSLDEVVNETGIHPFYKPFMKRLIYKWRYNAWRNYEQIKKNIMTKETIEMKANKIATELTHVHSKRDFYRIPKVW